MAARITGDVLETYVCCKYKGYLKLIGQQGARSDFEALRRAIRSEVKLRATDKICAPNQDSQVVSGVVLTTATLERGPGFVLDASIEDDLISVSFDGLKKVPGVSKLGQFLYIPMLFHEGARVRKEQRELLELQALQGKSEKAHPFRGVDESDRL